MIGTKETKTSQFATVKEVAGAGVKLHIDGESVPRGTFYNSLASVNIGDRVYYTHVSGTLLIIGKLMYK